MLKNMPFYIFVVIIACGLFLTLMPYPTFYSGTYNLSQGDISKINSASEVESYSLDIPPEREPSCIGLDWESVNGLLDYGVPTKIVDIKSEIVFNASRIGGKNHADIRPSDKKDRVLLCGLTENTALPRPCLVQVKEGLWTYASLCTKIQSDSDGGMHFCLYFDGSAAHCTGQEDCAHQKAITFAQKHGQETLKKLAI